MQASTIELGNGITQIDAEYMAPGVAALYLMRQGDRVAIIETGTSLSVPYVLETLAEHGLTTNDVAYVIPTHVHLDHAGGVGELMDRCPRAKLVIHPYGARHMINPEKLIAGSIAVYGEEKFRALYGDIKPVPEDRVIEAPDNFQLDFDGRLLTFLDTPGHARHHFCVYDETSRGIFSGDTFGLSYPRLEVEGEPFIFATTTPVQFDPDALPASIDRLMALQPQQIYLTHFGRIIPTPSLARQLKETVEDFRQIALQEINDDSNRLARLEQRLMDYLLNRLAERGCKNPLAQQREYLQTDVTLNAQGLDVWLSKNSSP